MINIETLYNRMRDGSAPLDKTVSYASATTVTIAGDYTSILLPGAKIEFTQNSITKYGYVVSSSYSSPNTTVTVTKLNNSSGTTYNVTNHTITDVYVSHSAALRDHPVAINYNPSINNASGGSFDSAYFTMDGPMVHLTIRATGYGADSTGLIGVTLPINSDTNYSYRIAGYGQLFVNGLGWNPLAFNRLESGSWDFFRTGSQDFTTGDTDINIAGGIIYKI